MIKLFWFNHPNEIAEHKLIQLQKMIVMNRFGVFGNLVNYLSNEDKEIYVSFKLQKVL